MSRKKTLAALGLAGSASLALVLALQKDMRVRDAVASLQLGKKKSVRTNSLCTVWSEEAEDGPDAVPLPEYPRPQMRRENWTCLNGWWKYSIRQGEEPMGEPDGKIMVPFSPETARSGVNRTLQPGETLWYMRDLTGLEVPEGRRLLLHFGAVDERCTVYWNGAEVGSHRNGYLPFTFDVTDYVRTGTNVLAAAVRDDTDQGTACRGKQTLKPGGMYYQAQSGIWQTVWLELVPEDHITDLRITPDLQRESVDLQLSFSTEKEMDVEVSLGETVHHFSGRSRMKLEIPVPGPRLWSPEHPYLYDLQIRAQAAENAKDAEDLQTSEEAQAEERAQAAESAQAAENLQTAEETQAAAENFPADVLRSYFAMRSFGVGKDRAGHACLLLNGEPFFFRGVLDQGYWPESLMTAPADEAFVYDITQMKKAGFNMLRKHVKIEPARWYYHCDRLGMVVWQDMINGGGPVPKLLETYLPNIVPAISRHLSDRHYGLFSREDGRARKEFEEDLRRMVRHLYNCPCIGLWTPFNEGWGQFDALRLTAEIRKEDPTRPVDHASGWFDQGGGDVHSVHNYFRTLKVEEDLKAGGDARPFVLTEYGGINCTIAGHVTGSEVYGYQKSDETEFPGKFAALQDQIEALRADGLAGAIYTQVSDIEEETNGLLTYDRKVAKLEKASEKRQHVI